MKSSEYGRGDDGRVALRGPLRSAALVLTMVAATVPGAALADTILTYGLTSSSDLAGSTASSPPTAFCIAGASCPGVSPSYSLAVNEPLTGTISIDTTNSTMTFDLTLAGNAAFGGGLTLNQNSTFDTTAPISVSITSNKGVDTILPGSGTATALGTLLLTSGFNQTEGQAIISGLDCSITAGTGGSCGFVLGTPVSGTNALQISDGTNLYNGVMSISANLTPVPLPPSLWLLAGGTGCLLLMRRRALG